MLLSDEELARLDALAPFLQSEAKTALAPNAGYEVLMELHDHLQPGLRLRAPTLPDTPADPETPPYRLDLFVGLPLDEMRDIANSEGAAQDAAIARLGATFSPRLLRAIATLTPHQINLNAGVQSDPGTLAVMLEPVR